ncbi:MAG TPA: hypothetical protein VJ853_14815 [Thermoanaerobaculia bacterium]|nr:hypothetical protein [Thermoanaerobaculia bacterium]
MNRAVTLALLMLALACKVEKTGQDTYKVVAPTPQAKAAARKASQQTATAVQKIGDELKEAGDRLSKSKTETTATTSTVETETGTKTETRSKTTTRD